MNSVRICILKNMPKNKNKRLECKIGKCMRLNLDEYGSNIEYTYSQEKLFETLDCKNAKYVRLNLDECKEISKQECIPVGCPPHACAETSTTHTEFSTSTRNTFQCRTRMPHCNNMVILVAK